jgi:hypothetical protein
MDDEFGGIVYGFAPGRQHLRCSKYFWVLPSRLRRPRCWPNTPGDEKYWQ